MKTYLYSFAVELSDPWWSMGYTVTTEAGNKKAAEEQVMALLVGATHNNKVKYISGSRKLVK